MTLWISVLGLAGGLVIGLLAGFARTFGGWSAGTNRRTIFASSTCWPGLAWKPMPRPVMKGRMNELMAHHTGQSLEQIERDTERDRFLSAAEAVEYGLVDSILTHRN